MSVDQLLGLGLLRVSALGSIGYIAQWRRQNRLQKVQEDANAELRSLQVQLARAQLAQIQQVRDDDQGPVVVAQSRSGRGRGMIWIDLLNVGAGEAGASGRDGRNLLQCQ